jgi:hypothetical protein
MLLLPWQSWTSFPVYILHHLLSCYPNNLNISHSPVFTYHNLYLGWLPWFSHYLIIFHMHFHSIVFPNFS